MKYTVHGPPEAGKTSVKQILLGKGPLPQKRQNSTNIMNTVRSVHTNRITSEELTNSEEISNECWTVSLVILIVIVIVYQYNIYFN